MTNLSNGETNIGLEGSFNGGLNIALEGAPSRSSQRADKNAQEGSKKDTFYIAIDGSHESELEGALRLHLRAHLRVYFNIYLKIRKKMHLRLNRCAERYS